MASRRGDMPELEFSLPPGLFSCSSAIGVDRHHLNYDENLDAPLNNSPPRDNVKSLWAGPVVPQRRSWRMAEEDASTGKIPTSQTTAPTKSPVPVVKAKATSLMSSLMIKQTQETIDRFEHQAGLTDAGYSPHKGLASAEDRRFLRLPDGPQPKLKMTSGDLKEDKLITSAESTPCGTPSVTPCTSPSPSPLVSRRNWFGPSPAHFLSTPDLRSPNTDMGGNEGGGGDRWSLFGMRSGVQKSPTDPGPDPGHTGFNLQSYFGLQRSSTMEGINTQINLNVEDPAKFMPPKMDISGIEAKRASARPHKLKPRDMNVLTPSGF